MKPVDIFEYNELNKNDFYNRVSIYIIVVLILIFISIIVLLKIKKNVYYSNRIYISNDSVITNISVDDLSKLEDHQYMFIGNDLVKYKIKKINFISDVITYYQIELELENNYQKNNIMEYKIQLQKENMIDYLISFIGG